MSLDGLRAWIGEVERKLGTRTRVFLVLVAIAVGGSGAAIYLAIDAQDNAASKSDLQQVRDELAGAASPQPDAAATAQLQAEVSTLQKEVAALRAEGNGGGGSGGGNSKGTPESSTGGVAPGGTSGGAVPKNQKQLEEAIKRAEEESSGK